MYSVIVTGGAGFLGSHLIDALMLRKANVKVVDNLSRGRLENIKPHLRKSNFSFLPYDLLNKEDMIKAVEDCSTVFHLAANPEVWTSSVNPELHFTQNIVTTFNILEAIRRSHVAELLVFTSSSTVYGEAATIPTHEGVPPKPISVYGASKLACEALTTAYAYTYGFKAIIYRLANIVGPRLRHGVIYDFIMKLKNNTTELEILGDGNQTKSYLYVTDCVSAMLQGLEGAKEQVEVFNIGSEDCINVKRIAEIVIDEMGLKRIKLKFTGGVNGGRGWKGDIKYMQLDISKLKSLGWKPIYKSEEAVRLTTRILLRELAET
jgi:UDP-glucose 4-epimerase